MRKLELQYQGLDIFCRPVFFDPKKGRYFGDIEHLFAPTTTKKEVLAFYATLPLPLNRYIIFFGWSFGCEPEGDPLFDDVEVILS